MKRGLVLLSICLATAHIAHAEEQISLAGPWQVQLAEPATQETWDDSRESLPMTLPGSLQEQGFGDTPSIDTPWTGDVKHGEWRKPQYAPYRSADNFKMPFWLQPDKYYKGAAWYQRPVAIPEDWAGKRIVLHLERCHWKTTVWIDGHRIGSQDSLSTPHDYDLTEHLTPGKHRLTLRVDNRVDIHVGDNAHSVSDHTQSNWNGIVGKIELRAGASVWLDDVQVYPDVARRRATVNVRLGNATGQAGQGSLTVGKKQVPVTWDKQGGETEFEITLEPDAALWDEFNPALHTLDVTLEGEDIQDARRVRFGLRELRSEGTQFVLNGKPCYFRGTLECCIFPLTGYPPTDVEAWKRIIRICKDHGLNHIRFHSWCPPEAAFVAADEMGFYYQVECAAWTAVGDGQPVDKWLYAEGERIVKAYGNHPSFMLMAYGNEPAGGNQGEYLAKWVTYWKQREPRCLHTTGAGWPLLEESQFHCNYGPRLQAWGGGLNSGINSQPPETVSDFGADISRHAVPSISHEVGQWCVYPDFDEIEKYTGVLKAKNFEVFRDFLIHNHMFDQSRDFLMASGKLQTLCYKAEIEKLLRTPGMGGFQLLDLHDFPGQGTALVGVLDPFWDSKPYVTPEAYRRFSGHTVPLARLAKRTWTANETLTAGIELAHYGPQPLEVQPVWQVLDAKGQTVKSGELPARTAPLGNACELGQVNVDLKELPSPAKYTLVVGLEGTPHENDWDFWVYPSQVESTAPKRVHIAHHLDDETMATLKKGGDVLLLVPPRLVKTPSVLGFSSVFWNTAWTGGQPPHTLGILCDPEHPVFADFPTDFHTNWQWWELMQGASAMHLDAMPPALRPLVQPIDTWSEARRLGALFEVRVGQGRLVVCSMDLESQLDQRVVARQLRHSLLRYMNSDSFVPQVAVTPEQVQGLFHDSPMLLLNATAQADSAQAGHESQLVVDGDPSTIWHTPWTGDVPAYPHFVVVDLKKLIQFSGMNLLPRQDGSRNGWIKDVEIDVSLNGKDWGRPVEKVSLTDNQEWKHIQFETSVNARYLRLRALSPQTPTDRWASLAELRVVTDEPTTEHRE